MTALDPTLAWIDAYRHEGAGLRVHGRQTESSHECRRYIQIKVRERIRRADHRNELAEYLGELQTTGFDLKNIASIASADLALEPWQIGEAIAEALLEETESASFPWPPSWDKRSATASLPGPDLVGFHAVDGRDHFLFGDVKSSDAEDVPGSVIYGEGGLRDQVDRLLASEERRQVLIGWLWVRARGQPWKTRFDSCLAAYFADVKRGIIVGVLVSSRAPDETHLSPVRTAVSARQTSFQVLLLGYYLPIPCREWGAALSGTEQRP